MHFDLADLRLIVRIAECNSLTRGAEASFLSLPAASTRIKNLEESVGAKLLYRTSQGVTLTPAGQAFVRHARAVLGQLEHLAGDMQEYAQGVKGLLRVAGSTTAISEFLPPVLRAYLRSHPDVNVELRERLSVDIVRAVSEGQTDIGIVSGPVRTEALQALPYRSDHLVLVVAADHPLAGEASVPFTRTLDHDHVGLHEASAIHAFLRQVSAAAHRTLRMRIEVGNFETACRLIEANIGVGIVPLSSARRHAERLAIRIVRLQDDWSLRQQYVVVKQMEGLPGFARDFVELLMQDLAAAEAASASAAATTADATTADAQSA